MPKKIIKHEKIPDEKKKNKVFKSRSEGLLKKVSELSILCGVDAGVVIHQRDENNAARWPSPEIFGERLHKFLNYTDAERERKMVTHVTHLDSRVVDESRNLFKSQQTNEVLEAETLTDDITNGKITYEQLDWIHMKGMDMYADEMLERLEKMVYEQQVSSEQAAQQPPNPSSVMMPPPVPNMSPLEDLMSWSDTWFPDQTMMPHESHYVGGFMGFATMGDDGAGTSSNAGHETAPPPGN